MEISIIGGDLRIAKLAEMYAKEKHKVLTYGLEKYFDENMQLRFDNNIIMCKNIEDAIASSKYIISGVPLSRDNKYISTPFSEHKIEMEDFLEKISNYSTYLLNKTQKENNINFIAGKIPRRFYNGKINVIDLLENEEFNILNSIPTVEGTIKIILKEREDTIHESNIVVCGFGRIGKILCNRLKNLGAKVYCTARKETDLAWIREAGYIPLNYIELEKFRR